MARSHATRTAPTAHDPKVEAPAGKPKEGHRETVEAIVVAMILALLVRGFEAEAFVIPTGSMAPTLMGRHKEVRCPQCGYTYAVNASVEEDVWHGKGISDILFSSPPRRPGASVVAGTCVNCRYQANLSTAPTFNGDRILVMKFPYDMAFLPGSSKPSRWDVVVFRYPEEPEVSYIKRLVGLPGETLQIWFGDIYIKAPGADEFRLERKPLEHQRSMAMMVYDDRHRPELLKGRPEWRRWTSATPVAWAEETPGSFRVEAATGQEAELRYHHLVPDPGQWEALRDDKAHPQPPRSTLITDFYSYNTNLTTDALNGFDKSAWLQPDWVGDLSLSARLKVRSLAGGVRFELIEGGVANRCELDFTTGRATLKHGDAVLGQAECTVNKQGSYEVAFSNIDDRLTLEIDGRPVFGAGLTYEDAPGTHPAPTEADLAPAAVTALASSVEVSDLVLKRDIYYTLEPGRPDYGEGWANAAALFQTLSDPSRFNELANLQPKEYAIGNDRFLMLGDNSPMSKDSRGWLEKDRFDPSDPERGWDPSGRQSWEVPRALLTGKAFFIYWPHGKPFGPDIKINRDFRVPFRPYLERMKWIR